MNARLPGLAGLAVLAVAFTAACDTLPPPPLGGTAAHRDASNADAPALLGVCTPGDETFCNSNGACDDRGGGCVCKDPDHFSPTDDCRNWHQTVLPPGHVCVADDRDYCHNNGSCAADGRACVCDDPTHFTPDDACSWYYASIPDPDVIPDPDAVCVPSDRTYCNSNGACAADGKACVCDDPAHYTPEDDCRDWRQDTTPTPPDQVCVPSDRTPCNGHGACGADGLGCVCDEPEHFTPEDDCRDWHPSPGG